MRCNCIDKQIIKTSDKCIEIQRWTLIQIPMNDLKTVIYSALQNKLLVITRGDFF